MVRGIIIYTIVTMVAYVWALSFAFTHAAKARRIAGAYREALMAIAMASEDFGAKRLSDMAWEAILAIDDGRRANGKAKPPGPEEGRQHPP